MIQKRGALELSVGTIVIIVLAMSMLILGLVLVRNIFSGATEASDLINDNVKSQIQKLFNEEDRKTVVYLPDNSAEISKGKSYNVLFAIRNNVRGESEAGSFTYETKATEVEQGCRLTLQQADSYIRLGRSGGPVKITPGTDPVERKIEVRASDSAPLCSITYDIVVKKDGQTYDTNFFTLQIVA